MDVNIGYSCATIEFYHKWQVYEFCMKTNQRKIIGDQLPTKSPIDIIMPTSANIVRQSRFWIQYREFLSTCGPWLQVVFEFKWWATYFASLRAKIVLSHLGMPRAVWSSMNRYGMFVIQTSTLPPSIHQKLSKHGRSCMQNNQLQPKVMLSQRNPQWIA